jgi:hypothetical protein
LERNSPFPREIEAPAKSKVIAIPQSAGCIIVTDEPHNVGDPFGSAVILIKSMEGLPTRAEIDVRCCKATRRRREIESSIRRRDRRRIIGEWALHRQDGIFGTDKGKMQGSAGEEARRLLMAKDERRRVVERAHSGEFWTILFSRASAPFFVHLVKKYYSEDLADGDVAACVMTCKSLARFGVEFLVVSLRRRRMLAPDLKVEFSEQFDTSYTVAEIVSSLTIPAVEPEIFAPATHAAEHLFDGSNVI